MQCQPVFIFCFESTGESAFRWDAGLGMRRVLLHSACESDRSWRACLPVLELRQRSVCFERRVCRERLVRIRERGRGCATRVGLDNG